MDRAIEIDMMEDEIARLQKALIDVRSLAAELYADRGEDDKTARVCNQIMRIADR